MFYLKVVKHFFNSSRLRDSNVGSIISTGLLICITENNQCMGSHHFYDVGGAYLRRPIHHIEGTHVIKVRYGNHVLVVLKSLSAYGRDFFILLKYNMVMSTTKYIKIRLLGLIVFIFAVNLLAMKFFWYISIWWFDMPMHFLGGVFLGFLYVVLGTFIKSSFFANPATILTRKNIIQFMVFVFVVGFLWELYEIGVARITFGDLGTPVDSLSDLFFDLAGGLFSYILILRNIWANEKNTL